MEAEKKKLSNIIRDLTNIIILIAVVVIVITFAVNYKDLYNIVTDIKCVIPKSPPEILLGLAGMTLLTLIGVPFTPALVFGGLMWLVIKYWMC